MKKKKEKEHLRLPVLEVTKPFLNRSNLPVMSLANELRFCINVENAVAVILSAMGEPPPPSPYEVGVVIKIN